MAKKDAMKVITETIDEAKKKAEPMIEEAKKKAEPVIEEAKKKAEPVIEEAKKRAKPVLEGAKKKAGPAADAAKKQADKAVKQAKKTTKSVADAFSEATAKSEIFIQYGDYEIKTEDMVKRVREAYVAEGHKSADIREVQIYIKPSDNCAYYVINHRDTGKVEF